MCFFMSVLLPVCLVGWLDILYLIVSCLIQSGSGLDLDLDDFINDGRPTTTTTTTTAHRPPELQATSYELRATYKDWTI